MAMMITMTNMTTQKMMTTTLCFDQCCHIIFGCF